MTLLHGFLNTLGQTEVILTKGFTWLILHGDASCDVMAPEAYSITMIGP